MQQITVRLPTDVIEELDHEADENDEFDSRADVIRARCTSGGKATGRRTNYVTKSAAFAPK